MLGLQPEWVVHSDGFMGIGAFDIEHYPTWVCIEPLPKIRKIRPAKRAKKETRK
jgi:hypothetical protein